MWKDLTLKDKSSLMKMFIKQGITSLEEIKNTYNEYSKGGNLDKRMPLYKDNKGIYHAPTLGKNNTYEVNMGEMPELVIQGRKHKVNTSQDNTRVERITIPEREEFTAYKPAPIRQGDFLYTPEYHSPYNDSINYSSSRQINQIPLERVYPEFDLLSLGVGIPSTKATKIAINNNKEINEIIDSIRKLPYKVDPLSKEAKPINTLLKTEDTFGEKPYKYLDYGTIPTRSSIGEPVPNYMQKTIDFYNKDVAYRESLNKYKEPISFNRASLTFNNNIPIEVRNYLDNTDFIGYATYKNNPKIVVARNEANDYGPIKLLTHEGTHLDQRRISENAASNLSKKEKDEILIRDRIKKDNTSKSFDSEYDKLAYSKEEQNLLNEAYPFTNDYLEKNKIIPLWEKGASNRELREGISEDFGFKYAKDLDKIIDNMSADDILYRLPTSNGYTKNFWKAIKQSGISREEAANKIKKALKYVPSLLTGYPILKNNEK